MKSFGELSSVRCLKLCIARSSPINKILIDASDFQAVALKARDGLRKKQ